MLAFVIDVVDVYQISVNCENVAGSEPVTLIWRSLELHRFLSSMISR